MMDSKSWMPKAGATDTAGTAHTADKTVSAPAHSNIHFDDYG